MTVSEIYLLSGNNLVWCASQSLTGSLVRNRKLLLLIFQNLLNYLVCKVLLTRIFRTVPCSSGTLEKRSESKQCLLHGPFTITAKIQYSALKYLSDLLEIKQNFSRQKVALLFNAEVISFIANTASASLLNRVF